MTNEMNSIPEKPQVDNAAWKAVVLKYQKPSTWRALWQIVDTLVPYAALWYLMYLSLAISWWLVIPQAILAGALPPERVGVYMGIFNFFIVIPEIVASLGLEPIVKNVFGNDPVKVVAMGGVSMLIAAVLMKWVEDDVSVA